MSSRTPVIRFTILLITLVLAACVTTTPAVTDAPEVTDHDEVHWSYSGQDGPEHWGELSEDFELCRLGEEQSPIDITNPTTPGLDNIVFEYQPTEVRILNNGHTIQVNHDAGSSIQYEGQRYDILQFHFHAPSEHTVDDIQLDAELHLVHVDENRRLVVVGVLITRGAENEAFAPVWVSLPKDESSETATGMMVNAAELLPSDQTTFRYSGSLTTPPCSEGVRWLVMNTPVEMSVKQITAFTDIFNGNNRPLQPLHSREVMKDNTPSE